MPDTVYTYEITPVSGGEPYQLDADSYSFDAASGRHTFKLTQQIVATLQNVNVRRAPASA